MSKRNDDHVLAVFDNVALFPGPILILKLAGGGKNSSPNYNIKIGPGNEAVNNASAGELYHRGCK